MLVLPVIEVPGVVISSEWERIRAKPSKKNSIASVATNEGIPMYAVKNPFTAPAAAATTNAKITLGTSGIPAVVSFQNTNGMNR